MDRVAVVTGASRGFGRATAIRLARDFGAMALVARTRETLAETAYAVRTAGAEPLVVVRDLRQPDAAEAVIATTHQAFGRIDALACIAGAVPQRDLFALTDEEWEDGLALKFHSARRLTMAAWDALKASGGSRRARRPTRPRRPLPPSARSTRPSWRWPRPLPTGGSGTGCRSTRSCRAR